MIRDVISQEEFASASGLDLVHREDLCFMFISEDLNQDVLCSGEMREAGKGANAFEVLGRARCRFQHFLTIGFI